MLALPHELCDDHELCHMATIRLGISETEILGRWDMGNLEWFGYGNTTRSREEACTRWDRIYNKSEGALAIIVSSRRRKTGLFAKSQRSLREKMGPFILWPSISWSSLPLACLRLACKLPQHTSINNWAMHEKCKGVFIWKLKTRYPSATRYGKMISRSRQNTRYTILFLL